MKQSSIVKLLVVLFVAFGCLGGMGSPACMGFEGKPQVASGASPKPIGFWKTSRSLNAVEVAGKFAYVLSGQDLTILDVSNPKKPRKVGLHRTGGAGLAIRSGLAAVFDQSTISFIDISDPESPSLMGSYSARGVVKSVAIKKDIAYAACVESGGYWTEPYLVSIDISNPASPKPKDELNIGSGAQWANVDDLDLDGKLVFTVDGYDMGLSVFDISTPGDPVRKSNLYEISSLSGGTIMHVDAQGSYVFVTKPTAPAFEEGPGLYVIDVSQASGPKIVGTLPLAGSEAKRLSVAGKYVYAVSPAKGMYVAAISIAGKPTRVALYPNKGSFNDVTASEQYVYVASSSGLYLYAAYEPAPTADFKANVVSGHSPLTVRFKAKCSGRISSWLWSFGDGRTSKKPDPTHVYSKPGIYTVRLTVSGPGGEAVETKMRYIKVLARHKY